MRRALAAITALAAATAVATAGGCGHTEAHAVLFRPEARAAGAAELFVASLPDRPYAELGLVQAMGFGADAESGAVLRALQKEGRRRGCDGVVNIRLSSGSTGYHAIGVCVAWAPSSE